MYLILVLQGRIYHWGLVRSLVCHGDRHRTQEDSSLTAEGTLGWGGGLPWVGASNSLRTSLVLASPECPGQGGDPGVIGGEKGEVRGRENEEAT